MNTKTALFLIIGMMACARGEVSDTPKNECVSSADCEAPNACRHQDCVNGQCIDVWKDQDQDGYADMMCGASAKDCDDTDANINPKATETCDCLDNDCNKIVDDACNYQMRVLDKSTGVFGCFAAKSFRQIDMPSNAPSWGSKPQHNTVFINALTEGWGSATVWYYGRNNKRYLFPSKSVFESWFGGGSDKCCVVRTVSNEVFNTIPAAFTTDPNGNILGGKVCYRPDAKIWKIDFGVIYPESDYLYVVVRNCTLRRLASEAVAEELFGPGWRNLLDVMPYVEYREYGQLPIIESRADFDPLFEQSRSMTIDNNQDL